MSTLNGTSRGGDIGGGCHSERPSAAQATILGSAGLAGTPRLDFEAWTAFLQTSCGNQPDVIEGFCNVSGSLDRARPPDRIGFCNGPGCAVNVLDDLSQTMIERGSAFADGELVKLGGKYPFKIIDADQRAHDEYTIQAGNITTPRIIAYSKC